MRVEVTLDDAGVPITVGRMVGQSDGRTEKSNSDSQTVRQSVASLLDSWQLDDEWWRQRISRRYVEIMIEGGKRMLLFEDLVTGEWFEQTP